MTGAAEKGDIREHVYHLCPGFQNIPGRSFVIKRNQSCFPFRHPCSVIYVIRSYIDERLEDSKKWLYSVRHDLKNCPMVTMSECDKL